MRSAGGGSPGTTQGIGRSGHADGGIRVVLDARPLQEPGRAPITAWYLDRLLSGFADTSADGDGFLLVLRALVADPTDAHESAGLPVVGRRRIPPTSRALGSAALSIDPFLLRAAELGSGRAAPGGVVYHTAGGAVPLASRLPVVATLLDLAPWELPERYAASPAARFGQRLRARTLRDAARVIAPSRATGEAARRLLRLDPARIVHVPLAPDPAFVPAVGESERMAGLRARFDLPARFLVLAGRYDARMDLVTLFEALHGLREEGAPGEAGPPVVVLAGAGGAEGADLPAVARLARREGVGELVRLTPRLDPEDLAALTRGAVAHVQPALSDATGIAALDALAVGVPVVASRVGALPEVVGPAGIIVEPRDAARLANALRAIWDGGAVARQVTRRAAERAAGTRRTWGDVAVDTRAAYAAALGREPLLG